MKNIRTSIGLIKQAITEKWLKQLAFYYGMKYQFANSCIYDYKSRMGDIAKLFHVSQKTLYNYFNVLRSKGLIFVHNRNLVLRSYRELIKNKNKSIITISKNQSLTDIRDLLYSKVFEQKAKHQAYMESIRRFERGDQFKSTLCESPFSPSFSYRTIAKLFNVSENKAFRIIKNLNSLGVIRTEKQKPKLISLHGCGVEYFTDDMLGYRFSIGKRLYEQFGCSHDFLQYPIYLKPISYRSYKAWIKNKRRKI